MTASTRYRLGIVGGLGPLASADLYAKITSHTFAENDQGHIPTVLASIPGTPDRTRALLAGGPSPLPAILGAIGDLDRMGVDLTVIACNTAHHWFDELTAASKAPILHIADAVAGALDEARTGPDVLLLATRGTLASAFYQRRLEGEGYRVFVPDEERQVLVDGVIAAVKAGALSKARRTMRSLLPWIGFRNPDAVLLACTELPVVWNRFPQDGSVTTIDATTALASAAIRRLGYGLAASPEHRAATPLRPPTTERLAAVE